MTSSSPPRRRGAFADRRARRRSLAAGLLSAALLAVLADATPAQVQEGAFFGSSINDHLGWATGLDGETAAVSGPGAHENSIGVVRIYRRSAGLWSERQTLTGSTSGPTDWFGHALALDGNVLGVGDWAESDGPQGTPGFHRGAAYVFRRPNGNSPFAEEARLQPASLAEHDRFGMAVALSGDVLAVSARGAADAGPESGAVYIFRHTAGTWTEEARLTAPAAAARDRFGFALALSGNTLAIGADSDDAAARDAGAVFVFTHDGAAWNLSATLTSPAAAPDDRFGSALSLHGDLLAVGVPRRDVAGLPNAGVVEVWQGGGASWVLDGTLTAANPAGFDNFGLAVDLDGERVLAGAPHADAPGAQSGLALLFERDGGAWTRTAVFLASQVGVTARFGQSLALSGELAVVGAPAIREPVTLRLGLATFFRDMPGAAP